MMNRFWITLGIVFILGGCKAPASKPSLPVLATPVLSTRTPFVMPTRLPTYTPTLKPSPRPTATFEMTNTWIPTPTPKNTSTPSVSTPTITSTPTLSKRVLYERAVPLCEAAFTAQIIAGSPQLPIYSLLYRTYQGNVWELQTGLEFIEATSPNEVHSLVCIHENRRQDAAYTDGEAGYTLRWDVRLVSWPDGVPLTEATFWGSGPPSEKVAAGPGYGEQPRERLLEWVWCDLGLGKPRALCRTGGPLAFSPNGNNLVVGNDVWDVPNGTLSRTHDGHKYGVRSVAFSPDGKTVASSGVNETTIELWDTNTGQNTRTLRGHSADIYALAYSPDGKVLASGSQDGSVVLWNVASGQVQRILSDRLGWVSCLAYSPEGKTLAAGLWAMPGKIYLWDIATGELTGTLSGHKVFVNSLAFSPDGKILASASLDDAVKLWDTASGRVVGILQGHENNVTSVAFSPDGKLLASGGTDRVVILWDVETGEAIRTLRGHQSPVDGVAFSPDGKILASSGGTIVKLWDISLSVPTPTAQP